MQVEQILEKLYLGNPVAEFDQNLHRYFIRNAAFTSLVTGRADLVAGDKGTGKSAIYKYLASQYTFLEQLANVEIITGFNLKGSPVFNNLKAELGTAYCQTPNAVGELPGVRLWGLSSISRKGNSPDQRLRSQRLCSVEKEVKFLKQLGGLLGGSNPLKSA